MDDTSPEREPDDDLAALDFFGPGGESTASDLDALGDYGPDEPVSDERLESSFTVTNPPGTVTVSALPDGRVDRIELSRRAAAMTEVDLADEIVVIGRLATQEALAAQYVAMLEGMRQQGHDDLATRDFLSRDLHLPSPDDATAARALIFTTRYAGDE